MLRTGSGKARDGTSQYIVQIGILAYHGVACPSPHTFKLSLRLQSLDIGRGHPVSLTGWPWILRLSRLTCASFFSDVIVMSIPKGKA